MKNPMLIGQAQEIDTLQPQVRAMLGEEGVYIGGDTKNPDLLVPLVSQGGRIFCLAIDHELDPARFLSTLTLHGPYVSKPAASRADEISTATKLRTSDTALMPDPQELLEIARATGLRSFLHGVNEENAREILETYQIAVDARRKSIGAVRQVADDTEVTAQRDAAYATFDELIALVKRAPAEPISPNRLLDFLISRGIHDRSADQPVADDAGATLRADEIDEFSQTKEDFEDSGETATDYGTLMDWAQRGLLECDHFNVTTVGERALAAAIAANSAATTGETT